MRILSPHHRREGVSLMEALIAVAIMTIGLLAILSFFPLAAFQMGQAFKDDRCTSAAINADQMFRTIWSGSPQFRADVRSAIDNPKGNTYTAPATGVGPVLVDPIGVFTQTGITQNWVSSLTGYIPREDLRIPPYGATDKASISQSNRIRYTTLTDDIGFNASGAPSAESGNSVDRGLRYNCSWLVSAGALPQPDRVELRVLVYDNRAVRFGDAPVEVAASVIQPTTPISDGVASATLDFGATAPPRLKSGRWVMFITKSVTTGAGGSQKTFVDYGFVRASAVTQLGGNQFAVDFDQPMTGMPPRTGSQPSIAVVFESLAEVFERGSVEP